MSDFQFIVPYNKEIKFSGPDQNRKYQYHDLFEIFIFYFLKYLNLDFVLFLKFLPKNYTSENSHLSSLSMLCISLSKLISETQGIWFIFMDDDIPYEQHFIPSALQIHLPFCLHLVLFLFLYRAYECIFAQILIKYFLIFQTIIA